MFAVTLGAVNSSVASVVPELGLPPNTIEEADGPVAEDAILYLAAAIEGFAVQEVPLYSAVKPVADGPFPACKAAV